MDSIFAQTYPNLEVVIVDDGSIDDLTEALKPYHSKIKLVQQVNSGAPKARNAGFQNSTGQLVIFCDADIVMKKEMLAKMAQALEMNPEVAFVYSSFRWGWKKFKLGAYDEERLKKMPCIHSTSLIRRECFPSTGWDESLKKFQDWDLWLTMLKNGQRGYWIDEILFHVRTGGTMSRWLPKMFFRRTPNIRRVKDIVKNYNAAKLIIQNKHNLK